LAYRLKKNAKNSRPYQSYPVGTLVLVKNFSTSAHRKLKPIFVKQPQIIIAEYHSTVYTEDLYKRVHKHSKNNIRPLSLRSAELFGQLPDNIKMILGDEITPEIWHNIRNNGELPAYLEDIEISTKLDRLTRNTAMPQDTVHLENNNAVENDVEGDELFDFLDETLRSDALNQLNVLHDNELLIDPNLTLNNIPKMYKKLQNQNAEIEIPLNWDEEHHPLRPNNEIIGDIDIGNILPQRSRRHVHFH
jgi:hypothetical protein